MPKIVIRTVTLLLITSLIFPSAAGALGTPLVRVPSVCRNPPGTPVFQQNALNLTSYFYTRPSSFPDHAKRAFVAMYRADASLIPRFGVQFLLTYLTVLLFQLFFGVPNDVFSKLIITGGAIGGTTLAHSHSEVHTRNWTIERRTIAAAMISIVMLWFMGVDIMPDSLSHVHQPLPAIYRLLIGAPFGYATGWLFWKGAGWLRMAVSSMSRSNDPASLLMQDPGVRKALVDNLSTVTRFRSGDTLSMRPLNPRAPLSKEWHWKARFESAGGELQAGSSFLMRATRGTFDQGVSLSDVKIQSPGRPLRLLEFVTFTVMTKLKKNVPISEHAFSVGGYVLRDSYEGTLHHVALRDRILILDPERHLLGYGLDSQTVGSDELLLAYQTRPDGDLKAELGDLQSFLSHPKTIHVLLAKRNGNWKGWSYELKPGVEVKDVAAIIRNELNKNLTRHDADLNAATIVHQYFKTGNFELNPDENQTANPNPHIHSTTKPTSPLPINRDFLLRLSA